MAKVNYLFFYSLDGAGVGCESTGITAWEVENPEDIWKDRLANDSLWDMACQNAESYGVYPMPDELDEDEDEEQYSEDIGGMAEPLNPEKHSARLAGGGNWMDHIDVSGRPYLHESGYWALDTSKEGIEQHAREKAERQLKAKLRDAERNLEYIDRQLKPLLEKQAEELRIIEELRQKLAE
ncbi:hypothetical protein [Vibrio phage VCPH]|nr:hypothetical protein [Vibrio phage VCPH]